MKNEIKNCMGRSELIFSNDIGDQVESTYLPSTVPYSTTTNESKKSFPHTYVRTYVRPYIHTYTDRLVPSHTRTCQHSHRRTRTDLLPIF